MALKDWIPSFNKKQEVEPTKAAGDGMPMPYGKARRLVETFVFPFNNPDSGTEFDDVFFQNLDAISPLDLSPERIQTAQRLSFLSYRKNVRAFCAIELVKDFALGDGVKFKANDPKVQALLEEHWEINAWEEKLEERIRALAIFGEQLYPAFTNADSGIVRLSSFSPFRIKDVNRNPDDAEDLVSVTVTKKSNRSEAAQDVEVFAIIKHDGSVSEVEGVKDLRPAFYFTVNRVSGSTRGIPDLLSSLDWLEGLDGMIFSMLERADISQDIVYDLEMQGLNRKELKEEADIFADSLRAGGVYAHNEKTSLSIKVPNLGATDAEIIVKVLLRQIQSGTRLAGLYFGDAEDLTRASASELATPVAKAIQGRQNFIKRMLKNVFRYQIQQAKKTGNLSGVTDFGFTIEMPMVFLRDVETITKSLVSLTTTLEAAVANEWINNDQAGACYRTSLQQLGLAVDKTQMEEKEDE